MNANSDPHPCSGFSFFIISVSDPYSYSIENYWTWPTFFCRRIRDHGGMIDKIKLDPR